MLKENETLDDILIKDFKIIQQKGGFRFGTDAVLLAEYAGIKQGETVMDLCTGNGIVPILLCAKKEPKHVCGLEISENACDMARRSVKLNGIEDKVEIICGNVCDYRKFEAGSFDVVTANPPYRKANDGMKSPDKMKAAARHEVFCELEDVVSAAAWLLKSGGRFVMVHRTERMAEIFAVLIKYRLEPKRMRLVCHDKNALPRLFTVDARKDGATGLITDMPLYVTDEKGEKTPEMEAVYFG